MQFPTTTRARTGAAALLAVPVLALSACGTADQSDLQNKIKAGITKSVPSGVSITSVSCPSNVTLKKGTKFNCTVNLTVRGTAAIGTYAGEIVNTNNDFSGHLINVHPAGSGSTPPTTTT
jgi:hypothetical protein